MNATSAVARAVAIAVTRGDFVITAQELAELQAADGATSLGDVLQTIVECVKAHARPPTSGFNVGAAALGASGAVYLGVNVELNAVPLNHSIHAEQFALVTAMASDERKIVMISTTAAPCGHCRQFMNELRDASELRCVMPSGSWTLAELLPHSFGPLDLLDETSASREGLLLEERSSNVRDGVTVWDMRACISGDGIPEDAVPRRVDEILESNASLRALTEQSHSAFAKAYAPYSKSPAGICARTSCGEEFRGWSLESAAYNPSMSPFQCLTARMVARGKDLASIERVVLTELHGAPVKYECTVRLALAQVAPNARLVVVNYHDAQ
jgi:cytidine deaminase